MLHILFICSGNRDRSPALERYFTKSYPNHTYKSAGVNMYHCSTKGTHYLTQADVDYADLIVYVEDVIKEKTHRKGFITAGKNEVVLNCGEFERDQPNQEYLSEAESILKSYLIQ